MPKTTKLELNINNLENDCEKVKFMADEYLHGELSGQDKSFIDIHIAGCRECFDFIGEEKKYLEEVKLAEYVPEISISQSVMDKIIADKIIIDKPPRKRFIPAGFISAAAVIIIMFIATRGSPVNLFLKSSQDKNANESGAGNANNEIAMFDSALINGTYADAGNNYGEMQDDTADEDEAEATEEEFNRMKKFEIEAAAGDMNAPEPEIAAYALPEEETAYDVMAEAPVAAPAPAAIMAESMSEDLRPVITIAEFLSENIDLTFVGLYYPLDSFTNTVGIFEDIEIYRTDPNGRFDIIEKKYNDIFSRNINSEIGDSAEISHIGLWVYDEDVSDDYTGINQTGEYIGIIYNTN